MLSHVCCYSLVTLNFIAGFAILLRDTQPLQLCYRRALRSNLHSLHRRHILIVAEPRNLYVCRFSDAGAVGDYALLAFVTIITVGLLAAVIQRYHFVGIGTLIAVSGATRTGRRSTLGEVQEKGAKGREGAQDENQPAFHKTPNYQVGNAVFRLLPFSIHRKWNEEYLRREAGTYM